MLTDDAKIIREIRFLNFSQLTKKLGQVPALAWYMVDGIQSNQAITTILQGGSNRNLVRT